MTKKSIAAIAGVFCIVFSGSLLAYGGMTGTASAMSGGRLTSNYSYSLSVSVPYDMTLQSGSGLPVSSGHKFYTDFDATQVPVHKLPPLPLTLDVPEENS